jgi:hypothetical protein
VTDGPLAGDVEVEITPPAWRPARGVGGMWHCTWSRPARCHYCGGPAGVPLLPGREPDKDVAARTRNLGQRGVAAVGGSRRTRRCRWRQHNCEGDESPCLDGESV